MMISLSLLMCLVLMFQVVTQPLKAHAVATEAAVCYIIATIALSLGLSVALNHPAWGDACIDIYNNYLSPAAQSAIDYVSRGVIVVGASYLFLAEWETSAWEDITTGIINYVNSTTISNTYLPVTLLGSSGKIGFTADSKFSVEVPTIETNGSVSYDFGLSTAYLRWLDKDLVYSLYPELDPQPHQSNNARVIELIGTELKFVHISHTWNDSRPFSTGTSISIPFTGDYNVGLDTTCSLYFFSRYWTDHNRCAYFDSNGAMYTIEEQNGKYCFLNYFDNISVYKGLYFDSNADIMVWLADQAGFKVSISDKASNPDNYQAKDYFPAISGDTGAAQTKSDSIVNDASDTGTITTALPATDELLDVVAANPAVILQPDLAQTLDPPIPVKPADLPNIDTGSVQLWTTKFPFCLPFDIYKMVSSFNAEPEAPHFHVLIMPENSFGLNNEDVYIDIDFEPYDKLVKILRFFLSISFVVFLILITRKIIS